MVSIPEEEPPPKAPPDAHGALNDASESECIESETESEEEESEEEPEVPGLFDHLPHDGVSLENYVPATLPDITTLEVVVIMLDWMTTNKITDAGTEDMWRRLRLFVPNVDTSTFETAKNLVKKHKDMSIQRIDICKNDCIAYWDCENIPEMKETYRHSHRTRCPVCGEPRYVKRNGVLLPRKVVYFTPIKHYLADLYRRTDLVPYLCSEADGHPEGHVTRSRGYKSKVSFMCM